LSHAGKKGAKLGAQVPSAEVSHFELCAIDHIID
jgi:hypothetical protein